MATMMPEYLKAVVSFHKDAYCELLSKPGLWSETMATRTLERLGSQAHTIEDVQIVIREYLTVLTDAIMKEEHFLG